MWLHGQADALHALDFGLLLGITTNKKERRKERRETGKERNGRMKIKKIRRMERRK